MGALLVLAAGFPAALTATVALPALAPIARAAAMDPPSGVVAFHGDDAALARSGGMICGGSLVVMSADGLALTLVEALPSADAPGHPPETVGGGPDAAVNPPKTLTVVLPGGRTRTAEIVRRGATTTALLVRIQDLPADCRPLAFADPRALVPGDEAWSAGNAAAAIELDAEPALSHGVISGLYDLPADAPPVRGRFGHILSTYRGQVIETDAAVNDGSQGGALLDADGRCIGLLSLAEARERRLGPAVPIHLVLADLGLTPPLPQAASGVSWSRPVAAAAGAVALVYLERPEGLGNPSEIPRPRPIEDVPVFDRERAQGRWDLYYHQQQVFYTDQPVSALVVDAKAGLLITAASNLHGGADHGRVLVGPDQDVDCALVAVDRPHDLALLKASGALPLPDAQFADAIPAAGDAVALVGRHRRDGHTVTAGVVAARDRHLEQSTVGWLQTDARADYGNLGGAVIDRSGRIAGMVALLGPDHHDWLINSGVGMAIDAAAIRAALPGLETGTSRLNTATLGLGVVVDVQDGHALVMEITPNTGAAAAGMLAGDTIRAVDGHPATSSAAISRAILQHKLGDHVTVAITRAGQQLDLSVELREFNREPE